jgi:thymidylate synthase
MNIQSLLINGLNYKMVADECGISTFTVNAHVYNMFKENADAQCSRGCKQGLELRVNRRGAVKCLFSRTFFDPI